MKVGLRVLVEAKPDKVEDVKNFLIVSSYIRTSTATKHAIL